MILSIEFTNWSAATNVCIWYCHSILPLPQHFFLSHKRALVELLLEQICYHYYHNIVESAGY